MGRKKPKIAEMAESKVFYGTKEEWVLEKLDKSIINNKQQALALEIIIKEIGHIKIEIDQVSTGPIEVYTEVQNLIKLDNQIDKNFEKAKILDSLIEEIDKLQEQIEKAQKCLQFESAVQEAIDLNFSIGMKQANKNALMTHIDHIKINQHTLNNKKGQLDILENKFHKLMPDICPLCDQEVK